jgi:hypothetical protein
MNNYFESLKKDYRNDYLSESPRKREVLQNAKRPGNASVLPNSNNRAVVISDGNTVYLQSYDTLILASDKLSGDTVKLWDGYSVTTMKHINEYLRLHAGRPGLSKREWEAIKPGEKV